MLLEQKIKELDHMSNSEKIIGNYIIEKKYLIENMTTRQIAKETFTSSSTVVRFAQRLGYVGFNELKKDYLSELNYINNHFNNIDPNIPFTSNDSITTIAGKIDHLIKESIDDTNSLLSFDILKKVVILMKQANNIAIFGIANSSLFGERFQRQMARIGKRVEIETRVGEYSFSTNVLNNNDLAILISYSGETNTVLNYARMMKRKHIKIIAITSIGDNSLSKMADYVINISTREKQYSKISSFSSDYSIIYVLDLLYSIYFALDFDANLNNKINLSKEIEKCRTSYIDIIKEVD